MKYVAFLRGVNVGGRIVKMADVKICLEKSGLKNVTTILQSGNAVFEAGGSETTLKKQIESALTKTFNYPAKAQVVSLENLGKIVTAYPFGTAGPSQHDYVIFMENGLEKELVAEEYHLPAGEKVQAGAGVVYWRTDKGSTLKGDFAKLLTKAKYKQFNTNRNIKTLNKILAI